MSTENEIKAESESKIRTELKSYQQKTFETFGYESFEEYEKEYEKGSVGEGKIRSTS